MLTRRIVMSACALCLAIPAAAVASPGTDPPKAQGPYGTTSVTGPAIAGKAKGPYGVTVVTRGPVPDQAKGPYGVTVDNGPALTAKAKGPYGVTPVTGPPAAAAGSHAAAAASGNDADDWRIVALGEAALLAALAFGGVALVAGRRREPRIVT
jgi:hypothetical protein